MEVKSNYENDGIVLNKTNNQNRFKLAIRRFLSNNMALSGGLFYCSFTCFTIIAPMIASFTPLEMDSINRLQPPSAKHWFGTDNFGRDVFSRVANGARVSLGVGFSVAILTSVIGLILGLFSAYHHILDHIIMRICDGILAFPAILLAIAVMAVLGPQPINVVIAITIAKSPTVARIVRSSALVVKEQTFIEAIRSQGAGTMRIIWRHIAPNTVSPLIVQMTYIFAIAIILEAALSFLGAGVPAPNPSWGNILYDGKVVIFQAWWMTIFPGILIIFSVLGLNLFGDGLRDLLDPYTNKANK